jgi:hypothetical protein
MYKNACILIDVVVVVVVRRGGIHKRPRSRNPTFRNAASAKTLPDPRAGQG